jgi:hypothetical protein
MKKAENTLHVYYCGSVMVMEMSIATPVNNREINIFYKNLGLGYLEG